VDLIGGRIYFESDPTVKPGTTCVVEMPLELYNKKPDGVRNKVNKEDDKVIISNAISLLIVDDIKMNRTMLRRRVKKGIAPNANITEAKTGEEALEICKEKHFDVIIMDQHMEEAGGVLLGTETVVELRKRKVDSVIVGCSGNDIDEEFMLVGTNWVMKKPTPPNNVIAKHLRYLLKQRAEDLEQLKDPDPSNTTDPSKLKEGMQMLDSPISTMADHRNAINRSIESVKKRRESSISPPQNPKRIRLSEA